MFSDEGLVKKPLSTTLNAMLLDPLSFLYVSTTQRGKGLRSLLRAVCLLRCWKNRLPQV